LTTGENDILLLSTLRNKPMDDFYYNLNMVGIYTTRSR